MNRVQAFLDTEDSSTIIGSDAASDVQQLLASLDGASNAEQRAVCDVLGWLFYFRSMQLTERSGAEQLARAIFFFDQAAPERIPDELAAVVGPDADPRFQAALAPSLLSYAERSRDFYLTQACVLLLEQAVARIPPSDKGCSIAQSNLAASYHFRYRFTADPEDLERAITSLNSALTGEPDDLSTLSNLIGAHQARYERCGDVADLDKAVEYAGRAMHTRLEESNASVKAALASNLASALQTRYEHVGILDDLERAITLRREAADLVERDDPDRATYLANLCNDLRTKYERTGDVSDIDAAIKYGIMAVSTSQSDAPTRILALSNVGIAYRARYARTGDEADLDEAIRVQEEALVATPEHHPDRAKYLSNLGNVFRTRYERQRNVTDLDDAIRRIHEAVSVVTDENPNQAAWLINLAGAHLLRKFDGHGALDPAEIDWLAQRMSVTNSSPPSARVRAGHLVAGLLGMVGEHRKAAALLDTAISLLPSVPPRESGWDDQEQRLLQHYGLVTEAVAAHCAIGDPEGAVTAAEAGRAILLASRLDARADVGMLAAAHPQLAGRYRAVRERLDAATGLEERRRNWATLDGLLAEIRTLPDFEDFLRPTVTPPPATTVLVNAGANRSDAVLVSPSGHKHVPLPDLTYDEIRRRVGAVLQVVHENTLLSSLKRWRIFNEVLSWLWDTSVGPILDAVPGAERVWWMPTGLLSLLPLHAAGEAPDRVVSSYIPTLRALNRARTHPPTPLHQRLTVAMQHTPGMPDLPGTVAEAELGGGTVLIDDSATIGNVLGALPTASWAHFACHATIDFNSPSQSGLHLHDGILPIADISDLRLDRAELAYLSACSTAGRGWLHADECLHLVSAFQLAGFRHVAGSLWPVRDDVAAEAARHFNQALPSHDPAHALHIAVLTLRSEYPDRPDLWSAFVHSGP